MGAMLLIGPREHDLGDFMVRRLLPFAQRRTVGPFIFFDHMGPAEFPPGAAINVRPHPHIGLATLTYLFEGQILHRDSLGSRQCIDPGDVNWMIAGRGIVHSERVTDAVRQAGQRLHGLQLWIALPAADEESAPEFHHHGRESLPRFALPGADLTLIAGDAYGRRAPVKCFSPLTFLDIRLEAGASLTLPPLSEAALYVLEGSARVGDQAVGRYEMVSAVGGQPLTVSAADPAHLVLIGGEPLAEPRHIFWNFVSSRRERLEQAGDDWRQGRFAKIPGDDQEFIPLPE
jgi:redox-sensitive bicupin YhaK (pirin superfamily)